jgi:hypothetical protein
MSETLMIGGEPYRLDRESGGGPGVWITSPRGPRYRLEPALGGLWRCRCPDAFFRRRPSGCKHALAVSEYFARENPMSAPETAAAPSLARALNLVMAEVGYVQKTGTMQGPARYSYAREADFIAALRPAMVKHGLCMLPRAVEVLTAEVVHTSAGKPANRVVVRTTFGLLHAPSGETLIVQALGEGQDVGDKATNKAMTGAMKYALRQSFCIETGDDPDDTPSQQQERAALPAQQTAAPLMASTSQRDEIDALQAEMGLSDDELFARMKRVVGHGNPDRLTGAEAESLIHKMKAARDALNKDREPRKAGVA